MGDWADSALRHFFRTWGNKRSGDRPPTVVTCRYCGEKDLRWGNRKGGAWEVRNRDGSRHACPTFGE